MIRESQIQEIEKIINLYKLINKLIQKLIQRIL